MLRKEVTQTLVACSSSSEALSEDAAGGDSDAPSEMSCVAYASSVILVVGVNWNEVGGATRSALPSNPTLPKAP